MDRRKTVRVMNKLASNLMTIPTSILTKSGNRKKGVRTGNYPVDL